MSERSFGRLYEGNQHTGRRKHCKKVKHERKVRNSDKKECSHHERGPMNRNLNWTRGSYPAEIGGTTTWSLRNLRGRA